MQQCLKPGRKPLAVLFPPVFPWHHLIREYYQSGAAVKSCQRKDREMSYHNICRKRADHPVFNSAADAVQGVPDAVRRVPDSDTSVHLVGSSLLRSVSSLHMMLKYSSSFCAVTFKTVVNIWVKEVVPQLAGQLEQSWEKEPVSILKDGSLFLFPILWDSNKNCVEKRQFHGSLNHLPSHKYFFAILESRFQCSS